MRAHRLTPMVLAVLGALMLSVGSASAATGGVEYLSSFNAPGAGFAEPDGISVNQSNGDVYVADRGHALDVFNSAGIFQSALTGPAFEGLNDAAIDEATGKIFVANDALNVEVYSASGVYETTWTGSNTPQGGLGGRGNDDHVAVDNSKSPSDPSAGDVYVAVGSSTNIGGSEGVVDKFNAKGEYLSQINGAERPEGAFAWEELDGITVNSSGDVYVFEGHGVVDEFSPEGKYMRRLAGLPPGVRDVAVNGTSGDLYVVDGSTVDLFNSSDEVQAQLLGTTGGPFTEPLGVGIDESSGDAYLSDGGPKIVDVFGPASLPPAPNTEAESSDTGTSVTLNGSLNPGGVNTSFLFSYNRGTTSCAGSTTSVASAGSGSSPVHEEATIVVEPNTQYTFCVYALVGELARAGSPITLTTPALKPTVEAPAPPRL